MTETTHPAATPTQQVIIAMWRLDRPATVQGIAEAATVASDAAAVILDDLHTAGHTARSVDRDGNTAWHLVIEQSTTVPEHRDTVTGDTDRSRTPRPSPVSGSAAPPRTSPHHTSPHHTGDADGTHYAAGPAPQPETTHRHRDADPRRTPPREGPATTPADAARHHHGDASTQQPATPTRAYRRPTQPRRPQGELRAAALTVLRKNPDSAFKVSQVRKAINAAQPDDRTDAGDGAVANALDKLVEARAAIRVAQRPATYQLASTAVQAPH